MTAPCVLFPSIPYCKPSPWPFLLFECWALFSLKYVCPAGPACLPSLYSPLYSRNPWDSYQPLHPFYQKLPPSAPWRIWRNWLFQFSSGLLVFSTGRGGSGGGAGRGNKRERRREKTGAVSSEVVGRDLTNSTARKPVDLPRVQPSTACTLASPALQTQHCLIWWILMKPNGQWTLPHQLLPPWPPLLGPASLWVIRRGPQLYLTLSLKCLGTW